MLRRSPLVALFIAASTLTCPASALILTAIVVAPIAGAQLARALTNARETADA
ncbi:hypothetical protein [Actinomadura sp. WMMA1423]|uniref:hypothetical protein n=1 Tax=Actinomadura sp. WMMA1423 TaxID=2591108 RepID=UPI00143D2722|nr:hypothetical protein [Actinomadura sp. WMMA1423]